MVPQSVRRISQRCPPGWIYRGGNRDQARRDANLYNVGAFQDSGHLFDVLLVEAVKHPAFGYRMDVTEEK